MACQKITVSKLYGIWVEDKKNCQLECSQIAFFDDGQFEAENLPDKWFGYVRQFEIGTRFNASGSWSLKVPDRSSGPYEVDLYIKNLMVNEGLVSYHRTVYIDPITPNRLYSWLGDQSNRITFLKESSNNVKEP